MRSRGRITNEAGACAGGVTLAVLVLLAGCGAPAARRGAPVVPPAATAPAPLAVPASGTLALLPPAASNLAEPSAADVAAARVERLGLPELIRRALFAAPELRVARWRAGVSAAGLRRAEASRWLPEAQLLSLTGIARRARGTVLKPLDTVDVDAYGPFTQVEVQVAQPIYTWGKINSGIEAAAHGALASVAAADQLAEEVIEQTKTLYWNVLLARSVERVIRETADGFDDALETARTRRDEGDVDISELDILYLRVARAEIAKELPALAGGEQRALEALRVLTGGDPWTPVDVAGERLEVAPVRLAPRAEYAQRLFAASPRWSQVEEGLAAKSAELGVVEADYYPGLFLSGTFGYGYAPFRDRQLNPFAWDPFNYLNGPGGVLAIRWLLNFHITAARAAQVRAEVAEMVAQRERLRGGLQLELNDAYRGVEDARAAVDVLEDGRRAGRAILTLAVTNFDIGIGDASEILQGLSNYARVTSDRLEAVRDYHLALARLARVAGSEVLDLGDDGPPEGRWSALPGGHAGRPPVASD